MAKKDSEYLAKINKLIAEGNKGTLKTKLFSLRVQYEFASFATLITGFIMVALTCLSAAFLVFGDGNALKDYTFNPSHDLVKAGFVLWLALVFLPVFIKEPRFVTFQFVGIATFFFVIAVFLLKDIEDGIGIIIVAGICWILNNRIRYTLLQIDLFQGKVENRINLIKDSLKN